MIYVYGRQAWRPYDIPKITFALKKMILPTPKIIKFDLDQEIFDRGGAIVAIVNFWLNGCLCKVL